MKLIEFTRVLPKSTVKVYINPDYVVWVQGNDNYSTIIMMNSGPEIEVVQAYKYVVEKLNETPQT